MLEQDAVTFHDPASALGKYFMDFLRMIPGRDIIMRYIASSYQNDPVRSLLELLLLLFAIRTILQNRTSGGQSTSNFVNLAQEDIDYLVDVFQPEPLCEPLDKSEQRDLDEVPMIVGRPGPRVKISAPGLSGTQPRDMLNLASYNFTGLVNAPEMTAQAQRILREYGVGSCSPPGFYGTSDMHMKLEKSIADFLKKEDAIVYSQGFSTTPGAVPAFCKRGDIIVADAGVSFSIQCALQLSRSTIFWYEHNNYASLEAVLQRVHLQIKDKKPLRRQFILTEGLFENDGQIANLPKVVELAKRFRFRIFLDETYSIGTLGKTGRGLTEYQNVDPDDVDFIIGNMAVAFGAAGGFVATTAFAVRHQRINGLSFVFSAAMPVMVANGATTAMQLLSTQPQRLTSLHENVKAIRKVLQPIDSIEIPSAEESALIHLTIRSKHQASSGSQSNRLQVASKTEMVPHDLSKEEQQELLRRILLTARNQGVMIVHERRLRCLQSDSAFAEYIDRPSLRVSVTSEMNQGEVARAADILRASIVSVLGERRS
ncbi:serine C-palmitoyltransferase [Malassezia yamatoensis]|uniref:serine C-palmitoyltransferase n=1 Tax=Malassezia yamatoensis TaxID=253288 RepID=A0AAJ5YQS6_9BASI|nr:serine C-palmitoyltransferase [Malassezia yamatoensis]